MVSNMSSIRRWTSGEAMASGDTGSATLRNTGCPSRATLRIAIRFRCRRSPPHWQAAPCGSIRHDVSGPALVDLLLAVAWLVLVGDLLRSAKRVHVSAVRRLLGMLLLAIMLAAAWILENATGGRLAWHPVVAALGVAAAFLGLALHAWARWTLAAGWSPIVAPPAEAPLVETGPYAHLRHPLYAAILLVAAGTLAAHPSRATLSAM